MRRTFSILRPLLLAVFLPLSAGFFACNKDIPVPLVSRKPVVLPDSVTNSIKTENVVIVVIDGPRYSETWGDPEKKFIPFIADSLAPQGVVFSNFFNDGKTYTLAGHSALTTGNYQAINNSGQEFPDKASIFQYFLKEKGVSASKAWVIGSKEKLDVLANTKQQDWKGQFTPSVSCGTNYGDNRDDNGTYAQAIKIFKEHRPNLVLIQFKEPDVSGHQGNWDAYLDGLRNSDRLTKELWTYLQSDSAYAGKTSMFVTNDHGRHSSGWLDGFISHGDGCDGCRHINLLAIGPDFKKGMVTDVRRDQIDVPATAAYLLKISTFPVQGDVMTELFR